MQSLELPAPNQVPAIDINWYRNKKRVLLRGSKPSIYGHCKCKEPKQSVHTVISGGLRQLLVPRLTAVAARELQEVNDILSGVALTDAEDRRSTPFTVADGGRLSLQGCTK